MNRGVTAGALCYWLESHVQQMKYSEHLIHVQQSEYLEHLKSMIFLTESCVSYVATVADVAGGLEKDF